MSTTSLWSLRFARRSPAGASAAELARRTFVTRQSLRDVLCGLRTAGLASIAPQPTAGRALPVILTAKGQDLLDRADRIVRDVEQQMVASLPPAEVRRLASLLTSCTRSLK